MTTPAFGFSVGGFISAINLIDKVCKSLKDAGGAASEYQNAVVELENLEITLSHLEALQPDEHNIQHVNAIRAMAMACKLPLQEFMRKMAHYESSLGPFVSRNSLRAVGQKVKWSITFAEDVEKLRALVAAKHVSINLLLGIQASKTLSKLSADMRDGVQGLDKKVIEHRAILKSVQERVQNIDDTVKLAQMASDEKLDSIGAKVSGIGHSVVQVRDLGQQIMDYLTTFPWKMQGLLRAVLHTNLQTYQLMLQMQQNVCTRPTNLLESNIRFEDALGEIKQLPYEYFRHWEPFEGFLRAHFRHRPGESQVLNSQYHIIDRANEGAIIKKDDWTRYSGACPRPGCSGSGSPTEGNSKKLYCKTCHLEFVQIESNLENSFGGMTILPEDEEVAKNQIAEDVSMYGTRPDPGDAIEVDEDAQLSSLPPKRNAAEFDAVVSRPSKFRKKYEPKELRRVTTMDWNSRSAPLDAWLSHSAMRFVSPPPSTHSNSSGSSTDNLAAKELEDLKFFRSIYIDSIEKPQNFRTSQNSLIDTRIHELRAQIYLRNILDRYPLLPSYLALRLAEANSSRAKRLDLARRDDGEQTTSKLVLANEIDSSLQNTRWSLMEDVPGNQWPLSSTQDGSKTNPLLPKKDEPKRHVCATCNRVFHRPQHLKRHIRVLHKDEKPFACEQCTECFARESLLHSHQQRFHTPSIPLLPYFQYHTEINAPTAMIRQGDENKVTYLNKGQACLITIRDNEDWFQTLGPVKYRTIVRISFEHEQQRQRPLECWQLWKEGRGMRDARQRSAKLQAVEYVDTGNLYVHLETVSFDHFAVTWSPDPETSTRSCSLFIRFHFLSTDFSHSKGVKGVPVRLYIKTGVVSSQQNIWLRPSPEVSFCKVKLFRDPGAERKLSFEIAHSKMVVNKLRQQIAQREGSSKEVGNQARSISSLSIKGHSAAEEALRKELAILRIFMSAPPASVLTFKGDAQDDPDAFPLSSSQRSFLGGAALNHHVNAGFWTGSRSKSRAASVHSRSSERNSSLHGSGHVDPEDQDFSFPDARSRRSSASFSETSATFPTPPIHIERQRAPTFDAAKATTDQTRKLLRFSCDICGQEIEVLRRRDWQTHVLQDLRPYVCTVEDCDEPTMQFESRKSYLLHEIRQHNLNPRRDDNTSLREDSRESAACVCVFCGEQTGGKKNTREEHTGRHMEEIAFAVLSKAYEDWDFYSDSSRISGPGHDDVWSDLDTTSPNYDKPFLCKFRGCERSLPGQGFPRKWNANDHMRRVHAVPP